VLVARVPCAYMYILEKISALLHYFLADMLSLISKRKKYNSSLVIVTLRSRNLRIFLVHKSLFREEHAYHIKQIKPRGYSSGSAINYEGN